MTVSASDTNITLDLDDWQNYTNCNNRDHLVEWLTRSLPNFANLSSLSCLDPCVWKIVHILSSKIGCDFQVKKGCKLWKILAIYLYVGSQSNEESKSRWIESEDSFDPSGFLAGFPTSALALLYFLQAISLFPPSNFFISSKQFPTILQRLILYSSATIFWEHFFCW